MATTEVYGNKDIIEDEEKASEPMVPNGESGDPEEKATGFKANALRVMKDNLLLLLTLCGVVLGFGIGFALRNRQLSDSVILWLGMPGEVFIRCIYFIILPLLVGSLVVGTASLDGKASGKLGITAFLYILTINATGVFIGLGFFYALNPAGNANINDENIAKIDKDTKLSPEDIFADLVRNIFPDNMVSVCFMKSQTHYKRLEQVFTNGTGNYSVVEYQKYVGTASGPNLLGIIVTASVIGYASGQVGEAAQPLVDFFKGLTDVIIYVMNVIIYLTPIGVLSLIATSVAQVDDIGSMFTSFGMFAVSVIMCTLFISFVLLPLLYFITFRKNPVTLIHRQLKPMLAGFAPPSSALAIPEVLNTVENKFNVDNRISRFCVLFGGATCRCGSAGYIVICSLFLAGLETGTAAGFGQVLQIAALSVASTLSVPAVPSSSVVCVLIILSSVGIEPATIGMVIALEWILDRMRTSANVACSLFGVILVNKLCSVD